MNQKALSITSLLIENINEKLPDFLEGFYVYGSLVLDDFHSGKSDIDFVAVSAKRLSNAQFQIIQKIYKRIQTQFRKPNLNGIYITFEELGKDQSQISPFPYFYNGKMYRAGYFECNEVTWYELKHYGKTLYGKSIDKLNFQIDEVAMIDEIRENLQTYWKKWHRDHSNWFSYKSYVLLFLRRLMEWGVLGVARQFYTFQTKKITSKKAAGEYCLKKMPLNFQTILK